jgi:DNA-binding beta-propeller fold protein YncE
MSVTSALAATSRPSEPPITEANGAALQSPFGLTVDSSDDLWLTDTGTSKLTELDSAGAFLRQNDGTGSWGGSTFLRGVAFGEAAGEIYVADSNLDDLWGLTAADATNSGLDLFGPPWDSAPHAGSHFIKDAVDNSGTATDGDIYVSNEQTVSRIRPTGAETFEEVPFSEDGNQPYLSGAQITGPFPLAESLATDAAGDLYVGSGGLAAGVYVFAPSGKLLHQFTEAAGNPIGPIEAIAVDPSTGNILAAEADAVLELSPTGGLEAKITEAGGAPFGRIRGLAVDSSGTLYVADGSGARIDVFGPAENLPPRQDGGSATAVVAEAATLLGEIETDGHPTTYDFQFGTAPCSLPASGCADVPSSPLPVGSGPGAVQVSQRLSGLRPATTYFYRLVIEASDLHLVLTGPDRSFTTQGAGAVLLPDNRAYELVSPPEKHGAALQPIASQGLIEAAPSGGAIAYLASAPTEATPAGNSNHTLVISIRPTSGGWLSRDFNSPHATATTQSVGIGEEFRFFKPDLSQGILEPFGDFEPALSPAASERTPYVRTDFPASEPSAFCTTDCYRPLVTGCPAIGSCPPAIAAAADVPPGTVFGFGRQLGAVEFLSATPDLAHVVLESSKAALTADPAPAGGLYEWSAAASPPESLRLLSVLPDGTPATGAAFGIESDVRNAISPEGSRVAFESGGDLYLRVNATAAPSQVSGAAVDGNQCTEPEKACTIQLDAMQGGPGAAQTPAAHFQLAALGASRLFFTDTQQLTPDSGTSPDGGDLYEYDLARPPAQRLVDLTAEAGGEAAAVQQALLGGSEDGSDLYFVADGVLAQNVVDFGAGPQSASPGTCHFENSRDPARFCNLYLRHGGSTTFIARLSEADVPDWDTDMVEHTSRVSPEGGWLAFMSRSALTGYDNRDAKSGEPDLEVFLYKAADGGDLVCASCSPTGARPHGMQYAEIKSSAGGLAGGYSTWSDSTWLAANIPGWTPYRLFRSRYQSRYLSDSGRLFFNSSDALVPQDSNGTEDVYQYEPPSGAGAPAGDTCSSSSATYNPDSEGCTDLISSGISKEQSGFLDASESGEDVFFLTAAQLSKRDFDTSLDVYDARVGGGEAEVAKPVECSGDACQQPAVPPNHSSPGTALLNGPGNLLECPKGKVKQKGKCVKKKQKSKKNHKRKGKHKKKGGGKKQKRAAGRKSGGRK